MSGIRPGRISHGNTVCVLQGAHPPGKPLQLWYYDGVLPEVQEDPDEGVMSRVRKLLYFIDPEGSEK